MISKSDAIVSAHFDCQFGAAGDMLLGAMLDAGVAKDIWLHELEKIALPANSFRLELATVSRCSIKATKLEIDLGRAHDPGHDPGHDHDRDAAAHVYNPTFFATHDVSRKHIDHGRHLGEILSLISTSTIAEQAKELAAKIFTRMARAESRVHGIAPEEVHFHEIGAVDAIIDIVGFAIAYDLAKIQQVSVSALPLGTGVVKTEHGIFPVPAPAVLKLLEEAQAPTSSFQPEFECLTPTGAAILCEICQSWGKSFAYNTIQSSGYGAGTKNPSQWPNVCRVVLGESCRALNPHQSSRFDSEFVTVIDANIDDQSPQDLTYAAQKILGAGALDVLIIPATMKKGRSGHILSVLCLPQDETRFQEMIITETSSIGARSVQMSRLVAKRRFESVTMENGGSIRMKLACDRNGTIVNAQPEFDDLAAYAVNRDITIKEAHQQAITAFRKLSLENRGEL